MTVFVVMLADFDYPDGFIVAVKRSHEAAERFIANSSPADRSRMSISDHEVTE